ncbi:MAG TPA: hypothetical protein PLU30_24495 [Verrucomicrobiae bacterium]|nr:hypothetical protein [Verrucomicrobiae bacterium]
MSEDLALSTTGNPMVSLYGLDAGERRCGACVSFSAPRGRGRCSERTLDLPNGSAWAACARFRPKSGRDALAAAIARSRT